MSLVGILTNYERMTQ